MPGLKAMQVGLFLTSSSVVTRWPVLKFSSNVIQCVKARDSSFENWRIHSGVSLLLVLV